MLTQRLYVNSLVIYISLMPSLFGLPNTVGKL